MLWPAIWFIVRESNIMDIEELSLSMHIFFSAQTDELLPCNCLHTAGSLFAFICLLPTKSTKFSFLHSSNTVCMTVWMWVSAWILNTMPQTTIPKLSIFCTHSFSLTTSLKAELEPTHELVKADILGLPVIQQSAFGLANILFSGWFAYQCRWRVKVGTTYNKYFSLCSILWFFCVRVFTRKKLTVFKRYWAIVIYTCPKHILHTPIVSFSSGVSNIIAISQGFTLLYTEWMKTVWKKESLLFL